MAWLQFSPEALEAARDWRWRTSKHGLLQGPPPPEKPVGGLLGGTIAPTGPQPNNLTQGMGPWDFFITGLGGGVTTVLDDWKNLARFRRPTPQEAGEHTALIRPLLNNTWGNLGYQLGTSSTLPSLRDYIPEFFRDGWRE